MALNLSSDLNKGIWDINDIFRRYRTGQNNLPMHHPFCFYDPTDLVSTFCNCEIGGVLSMGRRDGKGTYDYGGWMKIVWRVTLLLDTGDSDAFIGHKSYFISIPLE